jgi:PTH1 family peptidyl-tRNA hydrolase
LRFGIGKDFPRGGQIDYVLGKFPKEEREQLPERLKMAGDAIKAVCLAGLGRAMNEYNNK